MMVSLAWELKKMQQVSLGSQEPIAVLRRLRRQEPFLGPFCLQLGFFLTGWVGFQTGPVALT